MIQQMEMLNDRTVVANADLKADMERWHKHKQRDLREIFMSLADSQIANYEKVRSFNKVSKHYFPVMKACDCPRQLTVLNFHIASPDVSG